MSWWRILSFFIDTQNHAADMRDDFKAYFNSSDGEVYWQRNHVNRTN